MFLSELTSISPLVRDGSPFLSLALLIMPFTWSPNEMLITSESLPVDSLLIDSFNAVSSDLFFALSRKDKFLIWIPRRSLVILN